MNLYRHQDPRVSQSLRHSVRDGVAFSVMQGGAETYLSAFALFLKATTQQIAWLAALPALIGSVSQLISARLSAGHVRWRKRIIVTGAVIHALTWLPLMSLPLLFPSHSVELFIACVLLLHIAGDFIAPQWGCLMGDLVPERRRGRYFGHRSRLSTLTNFISLVAAGVLLHLAQQHGYTLLGYLLVFLVAMLARMVSVYHLARMHDPQAGITREEETPPRPFRAWLAELRGTGYLRFVIFMALFQGATAIASPFFTVHMLNNLHFSYLQFMVLTAASVMLKFFSLAAWGRVADAYGSRLVQRITGLIIPVVPALWLVSTDFWYLLSLQCLGGLVWAGFSLSSGNYLYELLPGRRLAAFMAINAVFTAVGIFIGALAGGWLALHWPASIPVFGRELALDYALYGVFACSALMRLLVAVIGLRQLRELRRVRRLTARGLIFRFTRLYPPAEMSLELIASFRKGRKPSKPAS
ncbi:MAG: MFS transporter [Gammaproteobacteria bacterium]